MGTLAIKLNDYFVAKTYTLGDDYSLIISYNFKEDTAFYEVLTKPGTEVNPLQLDQITPELSAENWIYVMNDGELILVDRYEKDIVASTTLLQNSGICEDPQLVQQCAQMIKLELSEHMSKINLKVDEILQNYGQRTKTDS